MWTSFRQKILSGSSSASMVLGQSLRATKPNFTQEWKFYTTSMKEAFLAGKDSTVMRNVHSHVSLGSTFSSKPVSGIHSLKGGSYQPCKNTVSFSSISGEPGMTKTETLDQLNEKDRKVPMPRSMWKGPFIDAFLLKMKRKKEDISNKKIWSRRSVILPEYVNCSVRIYNGKTFFRRKITEAMVGHKFGEFALTRKRRLLRQNAALNKKRTNHAANKKKAKR